MLAKIRDAEEEMIITIGKLYRAKRSLWMMINTRSPQARDFREAMRKEMVHIWTSSKSRLQSKFNYIKNKRKPPLPGTVQGVPVGNEELGPVGPPPPILICRGQDLKDKLTKEAESVLRMPPKTTIVSPININELEMEVEKMFTKKKWDKEQKMRDDMDLMDGDYRTSREKGIDAAVCNPTNNDTDMTKLRASHLPTAR